MLVQKLPLVSWENGAFMIGIFAVVCVILIAVVLVTVLGGSNKKEENN